MRFSSSLQHLMLLSSALILGSCAYTNKGSNQDITFLSPEGLDARCFVTVNKIKYQVWTPQTINVKLSGKPMMVSCDAPGNRHIEIEVPAKVELDSLWGTPVGMAWDYASSSMYNYPEVIAIDFSQEKLKPFPQPKHNNPDIQQPESYDLEEFLPNQPRLNSDKHKKVTPLVRRGDNDSWDDEEVFEDEDGLMVPNSGSMPLSSDAGVSTKGDLDAVIEEIRKTPTAVLQEAEAVSVDVEAVPMLTSTPADNAPVVLVPGE